MPRYKLLVRGKSAGKRGLIYGLVDPRAPEVVRYVGQTMDEPAARHRSHVRPVEWDKCARADWCRSLTLFGRAPDMVLLERVRTLSRLTERERWWIMTLQSRGEADLNTSRIPEKVRVQFRADNALHVTESMTEAKSA